MANNDLSGMGIAATQAQQTPKPAVKTFDATNVNDQLNSTLNSNSLLMRVAKSQGGANANQRGLINSSIGGESAMRSMVDAALPVAQQNASAATDKDKLSQQVVANTHGMYMSSINDAVNNYNDRYAALVADSSMPAADKTALINNMKTELNSTLKMYQQLYSNVSTIRPDWSQFPTTQLPGVSVG